MPKAPRGAAAPAAEPSDTPTERVPLAKDTKATIADDLAAAPMVEDPDDDFDFLPLDEAKDILNVVYYGREGVGKTTDVASMANIEGPGRVLIVNAEAGLKVSALRRRGIDTSQVVLWPNPDKGERVSFDGLERLLIKIHRDLTRDPRSWKGVGFDSLTEITKVLLEDIVTRQYAKAQRAGKDRDRFFIDRSDYGEMSEQVRLLIRRFRDLPCHFAATALERRDTDEDSGKVMYGPALTPALQTDVLGYVDLVLYVRAEEIETADGPTTEFRALTRPQGRFRAKDRFDATPRVLIDPTFARVHGYVVGDLEEADDPIQENSAALHRKAAEHADAKAQAETARKAAARQGTAAKKTAAKTAAPAA